MKTKKENSFKSLNNNIFIKDTKKLDDNDIAQLLGAEVDSKTGKLIKDENWICNFH
tara:strand:+ start:10801 stop:10968 length:168 start_codon:yes stop_codon:yes gene_type:complete